MRILPRINFARRKRLAGKFRRWRQTLTVERIVHIFEGLCFAGAMVLLLTGGRAAWLDGFGRRADFFALLGLLALFILFHQTIVPRLIARLEQRFAPPKYDERRILFDLSQEARSATSTDQLYKLIVNRIGDALQTKYVSIFVRDDAAHKYICRVSLLPAMWDSEISQNGTSAAAASELVLPPDAFVVTRLRNLTQPLVMEQREFDTWERAFAAAPREVRDARERERSLLSRIKAHVLLQIRIKEQLVGILTVGPRHSRYSYSAADKQMLASIAGQLAFIIENAKLIERMAAEEQLRRELALAAEVQRRLLPERPPSSAILEFAGFCQPARGIGGDYYDFLACGTGQISLAIADVSGKGISAALVMSNVQASLRSQTMADNCQAQDSATELVSTMNRLLCGCTGDATYVTFFYAQVDEQTRQMTYVNAGHNPPLLFRAQETAECGATSLKLTTGGLAVGMFEFGHYQQETVRLYAGDLLIAYTDGVTEALNAAGEEFGEERLYETAMRVKHLSADEVRDTIVRDVQTWCAGAAQYDDMTFIVLKVK